MSNSQCNIACGRLIIGKKIYYNHDTYVFNGTYYGKECIIKRMEIDKKVGIKSKTLREISFLKKIQHECIVKLYGVMYDDEYIYIILEKGLSNICCILHEDLVKYTVLDNILKALKYIEDNDYIHGDLNFRNIVMFENSKNDIIFKLIDFGSATKAYRISAIKKPACYVSPIEILDCCKKEINIHDNANIIPEKIDSWGFGCLSYYVTTGKLVSNKNIYEVIEDVNFYNTNIKHLLNSDTQSRFTIGTYYKENYKICKTHDGDHTCIELFKKKFKFDFCENSYAEILEDLLRLDILNNIPVENIFMTFKLIDKIGYKNKEEYICNCYLLFYVTTKLVCMKDFNVTDIMALINLKLKVQKIKSLKQFHSNVINILCVLDWNIDVDTQISFLSNIDKSIRTKYILINLAILSDYNLTIFSDKFLYEIVLMMLELENGNTQLLKTYDNHFLITATIKMIINSLKKIKNNDSSLNKMIQLYFKSVGNLNYVGWIEKIKFA